MTDEGLTLREAAIRLGASDGAIRKLVARGTLRSELGADGKRYVYLDGGGDEGADASSTRESEVLRSERDALIECQGQGSLPSSRTRSPRSAPPAGSCGG